MAHLDRRSTVYEHEARRVKVAKLLAHVPAGESAEANARAATLMEGWTWQERELFARAAGCRKPGPETWLMLCNAVRARAVRS
jgi:hypothetical protein